MKARSGPALPDVKFKPFDLAITIETAEEAQALYALFNYPLPTDVVARYGIDHDAIRTAISVQCEARDIKANGLYVTITEQIRKDIGK